MEKQMIRFKLRWRGREPGTLDCDLDYGVKTVLVQRGIAEFVEEQKRQTPQPVQRLRAK